MSKNIYGNREPHFCFIYKESSGSFISTALRGDAVKFKVNIWVYLERPLLGCWWCGMVKMPRSKIIERAPPICCNIQPINHPWAEDILLFHPARP